MHMDFEREIYLDHAAATPLDARVREAMEPFLIERFFNPSAPYAPAWETRHTFEAARADLAHAIGAKPAEVIITAGATESVNLAFGVLQAAQTHVITTTIEHSAVMACAKAYPHTLVPVNHHGLVDPADVRAAITPDTRLVSIGLANNEIGTVQPLRAISEVVNNVRQERLLAGNTTPLYLHSDASQCAGQLDVNVSTLGVDMLTLNAAKIYGPKQVGLLWVARGVQLMPLVLGGGQERGLRSGTENVAGAVGFAKALQIVVEGRKDEAARLIQLRKSLQRQLTEAFPDAVVSGHKKHCLPGLLHISFPGLDAERLVYLLESEGVYVATGAACAANKATRSHVLEAIGLPPEVADGSLRLTLGRLSTEENTARAAEIITRVVRDEYARINPSRPLSDSGVE
ncbi:MAG: cysteine desulfurase [Eggerthellaceae bacterium]|nr:cysteine desulfurase [Eggerthellaceae bacterium]